MTCVQLKEHSLSHKKESPLCSKTLPWRLSKMKTVRIVSCGDDHLWSWYSTKVFISTSGFHSDTTTQCCNFPVFLNPVFTSGGELESLIVKDVSRRLGTWSTACADHVDRAGGSDHVDQAGHLQSGSGPDRSPWPHWAMSPARPRALS